MAKLKSILGALSGKLSGSVFSHNKGGAYMRALRIPVNPGTIRQQGARNTLAGLAKRWALITDVQRQAWKDYAASHHVLDRLGDSIELSGESMYCGRNAQAYAVGFSYIDDAPGALSPHAVAFSSAAVTAVNATTCTVAFAPSPTDSQTKVELLLSPAMGPGQDKGIGTARHASQSAVSAATGATFTLSPTMTPGKYHNVWVRQVASDGSTSVPIKVRVLCP